MTSLLTVTKIQDLLTLSFEDSTTDIILLKIYLSLTYSIILFFPEAMEKGGERYVLLKLLILNI